MSFAVDFFRQKGETLPIILYQPFGNRPCREVDCLRFVSDEMTDDSPGDLRYLHHFVSLRLLHSTLLSTKLQSLQFSRLMYAKLLVHQRLPTS